MPVQNSSSGILRMLRQRLRGAGWSTGRIAEALGIGEATAKRWLAGRALTLDRIDRLAALCGTSLAELAREAGRPDPSLAQELTLAQERELSRNPFLALIFFTLLGGTSVDEIAADFAISEEAMAAALKQLERLALIDTSRGGHIVARVDRAIIWRKPPMRALFERYMKPQFLAADFAGADVHYASDMLKLSDKGAAALAELIEAHRHAVQDLAMADRETARLPRRWYGMLSAMRRIDLTALDDLDAPGGDQTPG